MDRDEARDRLRDARVGAMATVRPDGTPHVVPFVFVLVSDGDALRVYWAVDHKPKREPRLQRLENLRVHPAVEIEVSGYDEDWGRLWWVRASGRGREVTGIPERRDVLAALREKYPQYTADPPLGAVVAIDLDRITGWSASDIFT